METASDPLAAPATTARIDALRAAGVLDAQQAPVALAAAAHTPDVEQWRGALDRILLGLGAALLVAGIIFFFAYNWADLGKTGKFVLLGMGVLVPAAFALSRPAALSGQVALTAAVGITGALLAVYGQIYQTGADAWNLFAGWAALTLPWSLGGRFRPLWLLWLAIAELALSLWWEQAGPSDPELWMPTALAAINGAAWALAERWPTPSRWLIRVLAVACIGALVVPAVALAIDESSAPGVLALLALLALAAAAIGPYRPNGRADLLVVSVVLLAAITVASTFLGRLFFDGMQLEQGGVLMLALAIIGEIAGAAALIQNLRRRDAA
ncbi:MAG: DUF2157 domain-containing protein [Myxococcales bacterium]|nr:DUF2157 domain-containing protein [Myxococcales bacterium]